MSILRTHSKLFCGFLLAVLLFVQLAVLVPQRVFAIPTESPDVIASDNAKVVVDTVQTNTKMSLTQVIFTAIVNLLTFAANRLAYDAAVMLASGGADDQSLVEYRTPEAYFADYSSAVAGEAIGELSSITSSSGLLTHFNLCAPDAKFLLALKFGVKSAFRRPEPSCDFNKVKSNWKGFIAQVAVDEPTSLLKNEAILTQLKDAFDPQTNEFSVGLQLYTDILGQANQESDIFTNKLLMNGPTKDVVDVITGNVQTPASMIDYEAKYKITNVPQETSNNILYTTLANTDALLQVGLSAASVFANTLLSQLTNKLYTGLFDFDAIDTDPFDAGLLSTSSRSDAQKRFTSILSVSPLEVSNYNVLADFASCPSNARGLYNCVADTSFITAVARADAGVPLTLSEAIDDDLIDGGWPLISSEDTARDQDPYCSTYGFCHSNLVKLRKARIISVGWELAAESTANSINNPVTLQEVIDGFYTCDANGEIDESHPWCGLIDPNWVLKYPDTQCRALVYGQLLETSAAATRKQECVDAPSCIDEDADGNCTGGYGYCVREENTWNFRGDECPEYAASCLTFTDPNDESESYLLNTVDYATCDEDNAGCLWYATQKTEAADGTFAWPTVASVAASDAAEDAYQSRIYLTSQVETCDEDDGGCTELIERDSSLRLNAIVNPGFEDDADEDSVPDAWIADGSGVRYDVTNAFSLDGSAAVSVGASSLLSQTGIAIEQGMTYTLSYYARQPDDESGYGANVTLAFANEDNAAESIDLRGTAYAGACSVDTSPNTLTVFGSPNDSTYSRYTCTLTSPLLDDRGDQLFATISVRASGVWFDNLQLEQGEDVSDYHEGYSTSDVSTLVVKVPPSYLGCTGDADTDPADCANYALVCAESEVGCTQYSPSNGDPDVFGITDDNDICPSSCVGYDTFKQEVTLYEPSGDFPVYFIPDTAESCSFADVGCDEFTKLDDETLAYFTYVRACLTTSQAAANTDGDQKATFYTWEGSDLDGYQLKTWNLLESDMDGYASATYAASGLAETNPGHAPCTSWTTDADGVTCNDDVLAALGDFDKDASDCDEHDDIFTNPSCREFYDTDGNIHYRDWSLTVTVNDACTSYRKTDLVGLGEDANANGTDDGHENCTDSGGYFDTATSVCRYYGYADESTSCEENANGCRNYTGGRSRNSSVVLEELFEDGNLSQWEARSASDVTYSNESVATDGHSLASTGESVWSYVYDYGSACAEATEGDGCAATTTGTLGGNCTVENGSQFCGTLVGALTNDKTYTLSFWAKGDGDITAGFDVDANTAAVAFASTDPVFDTAKLSTSSWKKYELGPLNITADAYPTFGDSTVLAFVPDSGVTFAIDNIVLREGEDNITVIKDSWVTPAECDEAADGTLSPQYYLGCQEYSTQDGDVVNASSFSSLCREEVVGCEDFFATHESDASQAQVYGATCSTLDGAPASTPTDCYRDYNGAGAYDTSSPFLCTIGVGLPSCTFDIDYYLPRTSFTGVESHLSYGPSTHIVPADSSVFLVVNDDVTCDTDAAGCTELGLPTFSQDRQSIGESTSTYLVNDPESYADILCSHDDLFCQAYETDDDGTFYFKDPVDQTCEYRTDVTVNGSDYDGWFRTDTDEFCYGTCTASGDACSSDADCGAGDSCDTTRGSYIVGGDQSGVWKNGDAAYGGWVASCDEQYSTCTEFQDLLDIEEGDVYGEVDGQSYFYLDNDSLEESTLADSQKCDGRASQKAGCALFHDTTTSSVTSSMSATYVASEHADALFGDAPFALVDPIDCDNNDATITTKDGRAIDLCSQRCAYNNERLEDGIGLPSCFDDASCTPEDAYTFGTSCYEDADCGPLVSEAGDYVEGICATDILDENAFGSTTYISNKKIMVTTADYFVSTAFPRLENDANRVVKVNRDRQCSEWLTCSDTQTVWDESTARYKNICGDLSLCNEYSASGNASFCSSPVEDSVATILDADRYSGRDVSWYGDEYSGYAIPDSFPVELLTQVVTSPPAGACDMTNATNSDGSTYDFAASAVHGALCTEGGTECDVAGVTGGECVSTGTEDTYALVFNAGSCSADYGESCTVGYCENTLEACSSQSECTTDAGACIIGTCYDVDTTSTCTQDSQCSDGFSCVSGTCADPLGTLDVEYATCAEGGFTASVGTTTLYESVLTKLGTCVREKCLLTQNGEPFDIKDTSPKLCRAHPESDSPFPNEVVDDWKYFFDDDDTVKTTTDANVIDADGTGGWGAVPYSTVTGFENAKFCPPNEECDCSYKKVTYGDSGDMRYLATDSVLDNISIGSCSGGTYDGALCSSSGTYASSDDNHVGFAVVYESTCTTGGGTCTYPTRTDSLLGMDGYCLETDTSINIHGNRDSDHRACLTWLPVDQLVGSTDLYAKYKDAGYFTDSYACVETRPYVDLPISNYGTSEYETACAFLPAVAGGCYGGDGGDDGDAADWVAHLRGCATNVACPNDYFALLGACSWSDTESGYDAGTGKSTSLAGSCTDIGRGLGYNDCPYVCVPEDAHTSDGASCTPNPDNYDVHTTSDSGTEVYGWLEGDGSTVNPGAWFYDSFDELVDSYSGCYAVGTQLDQGGVNSDILAFPYTNYDAAYPDTGYEFLSFDVTGTTTYPACKTFLQVADGDQGFAWTDKIYNAARSAKNAISNAMTWLQYRNTTLPTPYGVTSVAPTSTSESMPSPDNNPLKVAACHNAVSEGYELPTDDNGDGAFDDCDQLEDGTDFSGTGNNTSDPDTRSFIDFLFTFPEVSYTPDYSDSWSTGSQSSLFSNLTQIFARPAITGEDYAFSWSGDLDTSSYRQYNASDTSAYSDYDTRAESGEPPKVWSLDTTHCSDEKCEEGNEGKLTLNSTDSGDQTGSDFFRAYLKFYAAANENQLPIRRIIVDWQDDADTSESGETDRTGSVSSDNYFKNHRGLQEGSTASMCSMDPENDAYRWGMSSASCDSNYLSYSNIYTCTEGNLATYVACAYGSDGNITNSPCTDGISCYFRPRVHIQDNWGWCTGKCSGGEDDSSGCFVGEGDISVLDSSSNAASECAYLVYPDSSIGNADPWVYYDGAIVVTP